MSEQKPDHASDSNKPVYPFDNVPESGEFMPVADGVYWLRMPLPISLNHINLWLIEGTESFTLVDSGWHSDETTAIWEKLGRELFKDKPVERVVVTHMHPDHVGMAGWLTQKHQVPLFMSRAEYLNCQLILSYTNGVAPEETLNFYHAAGYDKRQLQNYRAHFGHFSEFVHALPHAYQRLRAGDTLNMGNKDWQIVVGEGHSPEHVCLHNPADKLFISGDQLLPTISSNISVWPTEPQANPLGEWLASCHRLSEVVTDDTLVLPSHGKPFYGGPARLAFQIQEIHENLAKLTEYCATPRRAVDVFEVLFKSKITGSNLMMATGESLAHLHYLREQGVVAAEYRAGVAYWQRT